MRLGCRVVRVDLRDNGQSEHLTGQSVDEYSVILRQLLIDWGLGGLADPVVAYSMAEMATDAAELLEVQAPVPCSFLEPVPFLRTAHGIARVGS